MKKLVFVFAMISVSLLSDPIYRLPPITYPTKEEQIADFLNDGKWLIALSHASSGVMPISRWVSKPLR